MNILKPQAATCGQWIARNIASAILALAAFSTDAAMAQMGPDYWRVSGVAENDILNIRSGPGTEYYVVAAAPNGAIFRNLGCRGEGKARWCHLETPDGQVSGWAAGRYLVESGAPNTANLSGSDDVPELHVRNTGEIEVRFASGCTVLYNPAGKRITAGSSCSQAQLSRAHDAVEGHLRETAGSDSHEGGATSGEDVNISGVGTIIGGGVLTGSIFGHKEGHYALSMIGDGMVCTGTLQHAPGAVGSETTSIHCSTGGHGTAILASRKSGILVTFNLTDGTGGYVSFD